MNATSDMSQVETPWFLEPEADPLRLKQLAWRHIRSDPQWHDLVLLFAAKVEELRRGVA